MIKQVELSRLRLPMKKKFGHHLAEHSATDNLILKIKGDNIFGVGEAIPRVYVTGEKSEDIYDSFSESNALNILREFKCSSLDEGVNLIDKLNFGNRDHENFLGPAIACLVELALIDIIGKKFNTSADKIFRKILSKKVAVLKEQSFYPFTTVLSYGDSLVDRIRSNRVYAIKLKVGKNIDQDIEQLNQIKKLVGTSVPVFIDGNCCWDYQDGIIFSRKCKDMHIAWMEEPLNTKDYQELASFRDESGIKIMLDENCLCMEDLIEAHKLKAFDMINLRISKNGGVFHLMEMYEFIAKNGYKAQLGVQVGEMGPLWACGRKLMQAGLSVQAYEAGQIDLLVNEYDLLESFAVNRVENHALPIFGPGFGISEFEPYLENNKQDSFTLSL